MSRDAERRAFLDALAKDEDDVSTRLVYADWLDDRGEHEEADRMRKWPAAKEWLVKFCEEYNYRPNEGDYYPDLSYERILDLGREAMAEYGPDGGKWGHGFSCGANQTMQTALYDNKETFWRNWSIITGVPLPEGFVENSYFGCAC